MNPSMPVSAKKPVTSPPGARPDGTLRLIKAVVSRVGDDADTPVHAEGVAAERAERERVVEELHESNRRLSDMLGNVQMVAVTLDAEGRITYCNDFLLRLTGWERAEVLGKDWFALFVAPGDLTVRGAFLSLLGGLQQARLHENEIVTRAGARRLIRWNNSVLHSADGSIAGTASIGDDITEQKLAETKIKRLSRVHAVLSGINTLIVRVRDRDELFTEACRVAVDHGQFRAAAIGLVDPARNELRMVASAGCGEELIVAIDPRMDLAQLGPGAGTVAETIHWRVPVVVNDVANDPSILRRNESLSRGIGSIALLPLQVSGDVVGLLALFAEEAGFFDAEEMRLLIELTGDIAFAIDHIGKVDKLDYLAYYDVLTGLANRNLFLERIAQSMRLATAGTDKLALLLVDLERFRVVNDDLGRPAGDSLLVQVAAWLAHQFGGATALARIGADQFAVLLPDVSREGDVARLVEKALQAFSEHAFELNGSEFRLSARFGVALFPDDSKDAEVMLKHAEAALQKAKSSGERYLFYAQKMTDAVAGRLTLENELRQALVNEEFVLHYQPKVDLRSGQVIGAEALLRWNDPRTGLVPPMRFIPILEETGLIIEVGRWALREAIAQYLRWSDAGVAPGRIAVNVSALQLRHRGFVAEVEQGLAVDPRAAAGLELQITESKNMGDDGQSNASLTAIRAMGVTVAIDDFGTGFSSLGYLAKWPVDALKIDRSFVVEINTAPEGMALVSTIIQLARSLGLKVVAEGVETEEQRRFLQLLGCDQMQGYLFGRPVPAEEFVARFLAPPTG
jgi:diguanylate cyclase (GGDEF)-like protein/PAS domain S-box-containing protein